ncbi:MAG TPA: ribulose-phosphate 3-epimerase [Balneolaceae bacterium]|nr:ribulose-phosphate 3-epimerase [Balneolaceae bacterium]
MTIEHLPILAPSILAADYRRLGKQIKTCTQAGTEWIHCDIMDGHFVPNISFGPMIVEAAGRSGDVFLDVHLMIEHPEQYIENFAEAGSNSLTVHQEVCPHLHRVIQQIKQQGLKAGVAVNPATPLQQIVPIIADIDILLIMSVNPGFGGQTFIESTYKKIREACSLRRKYGASFLIEVDGGINLKNIADIHAAGADIFVVGSNIFKSPDISEQIDKLNKELTTDKNLYV